MMTITDDDDVLSGVQILTAADIETAIPFDDFSNQVQVITANEATVVPVDETTTSPLSEPDDSTTADSKAVFAVLLLFTVLDVVAAIVCFLPLRIIDCPYNDTDLLSISFLVNSACMILLGAGFSLSAIKKWEAYGRDEHDKALFFILITIVLLTLLSHCFILGALSNM